MNQTNFIEHTEGKHTFTIPELVMSDEETVEDFLHRERDTINRAVLVSIKLMVKLELETVPAFAVEGIDIVFALSRDEAIANMEKYVEYFSEVEEYEKCGELINLKSKL